MWIVGKTKEQKNKEKHFPRESSNETERGGGDFIWPKKGGGKKSHPARKSVSWRDEIRALLLEKGFLIGFKMV